MYDEVLLREYITRRKVKCTYFWENGNMFSEKNVKCGNFMTHAHFIKKYAYVIYIFFYTKKPFYVSVEMTSISPSRSSSSSMLPLLSLL